MKYIYTRSKPKIENVMKSAVVKADSVPFGKIFENKAMEKNKRKSMRPIKNTYSGNFNIFPVLHSKSFFLLFFIKENISVITAVKITHSIIFFISNLFCNFNFIEET